MTGEQPPGSSAAPGTDHPPAMCRAELGCSPYVLRFAASMLWRLRQCQCRASVAPSLLCLLTPGLVGTVLVTSHLPGGRWPLQLTGPCWGKPPRQPGGEL